MNLVAISDYAQCMRPDAPAYAARMKIAAVLILCLCQLPARAASADGPYVLRDSAGGWQAVSVAQGADGAFKESRPVNVGATITVNAVGTVPAFQVRLRPRAAVSPDEIRFPARSPLFVVADTHGEYEILVMMLRAHGVIGARLEWKFGRGHLAVLGDVFDRGPNHLEILWLLYQLEAEARKAGGGVHLVLGNHETMVLRGDLRYLNARYAESTAVFGAGSYSELFAADSLLGQWLRSKPAVLKLNEFLCLHAGVSRALLDSTLTLADINSAVRSALEPNAKQDSITELVMGQLGPLWYRGYFAEQSDFPTATMPDVDQTLKNFAVRRVLIGHTIVPTVTPLYDGKIIAVQVYPMRDDAGRAIFDSLLIRDGQPFQARLDGSVTRLGTAGSD
jgi:hypothetical protein